MELKITKEEYKKHRFPICILLYYIILSIVSVFLLEIHAIFIIDCGLSGFLDKLAGIAVILFAGGVLWFLECLVFQVMINKRKIYRGIGIMRFLTLCTILSPLIFVILIIALNVFNINFIFFNVVTLFVECAIPFLLALHIKEEIKYSIYICPDCGLINSFVVSNTKRTDLGTRHKFHNEGGYTHTWKTSAGIMVQDVPTTAVYDGEFKKWDTTTYYKCSICGSLKITTRTTETRID